MPVLCQQSSRRMQELSNTGVWKKLNKNPFSRFSYGSIWSETSVDLLTFTSVNATHHNTWIRLTKGQDMMRTNHWPCPRSSPSLHLQLYDLMMDVKTPGSQRSDSSAAYLRAQQSHISLALTWSRGVKEGNRGWGCQERGWRAGSEAVVGDHCSDLD